MSNDTNLNKSPQALREESVLQFWQENQIFEKTLEKNKDGEKFVFFEGPPTANAKPALHHLEARAFKDVIPRYKTMQGFNVPRRAGWDTHGLPVELQIEKKLGLASKKEIEQYGVAQFNKECKDSVFEYIGEWEKFTDRIGYWVDKEKAYYTFDTNYIESLWSIVGHVNEQNLLYKDYKVVPWCPRCGTGLSSHELAQGYQDVKDLSVYAKFKIIGFDGAYFLAWTTTPWTLPGNVGLAVGADIIYVELKVENEIFVLAKERVENLFEAGTYEIIAEHNGSEMLGMEYEPLYPYLKNIINGVEVEKIDKAYKVYVADFVTTTDGTGIVHTAVMYGQDDFALGTDVGLPKFHTVDETGHFVSGTDFLQGRFVKDEEVAIDIIKDLAHRGLLFKKEKYEHSYPHCWRCKTPLIYYARDSWYIAMSELRDKMVKENQNINWEPAHIREGRFGEWLVGIKDWAISRERYWGTPLPIWVANDGDKIVVDSFDTLKKYTKKSGNKYFLMRHGEAENNIKNIWDSVLSSTFKLTDKGIDQVKDSAIGLKDKNIDLIICSPLLRTKMTAELVAETIGYDKSQIIIDERLCEINPGDIYQGKHLDEFLGLFPVYKNRYTVKNEHGENYQDVKNRMMGFLYEIEQKYKNKNILILSHGGPILNMKIGAMGLTINDTPNDIEALYYPKNAEWKELEFTPLPHNANYELDPHRPFIDDVVLEKDGIDYHRTKEVMDVWFDSGAMPFAQDHYMFKDKNILEKVFTKDELDYPADFISEAIDQTRGWFYTLHAIGALTGKGKAYKNVICLGHLLDANGKKMSKSIGNIVEPWSMMDKYGADTLRLWMYSVNQPGDSKNFDEKTVKETEGKILTLLYNVLSFYELYRDKDLENNLTADSLQLTANGVLDQWILSKLNELVTSMTNNLDGYKLLEPVREMREFIGDLSTWYLRRSRDRLKDGDVSAKQTLYYVLKTIAKLMAPFAPFSAEDIWQKLKTNDDVLSVHLTEWPKALLTGLALNKGEVPKAEGVIAEMQKVRDVCTEGNALRKKLNIAVKQPLSSFTVAGDLSNNYFEIIKDELNVKEILIGTEFTYDTIITPELKREGNYRELVRALQDLRKETGLTPDDIINLKISENSKELLSGFENDLKRPCKSRILNLWVVKMKLLLMIKFTKLV
jgi:isoleucyl-tRNA synthetase